MLALLHNVEAQRQAFVDNCAWAEDIYLCLGWIEPGDAHGPSFPDLEPHLGKVRQAIVGLARMQSSPSLLRKLRTLSVLRLVSILDGSFSPNFYLFRRANRVRLLFASVPFTSTRFAKPCESFVAYEGDQNDAFVLQAMQLLERCRAAAHVPLASEIEAYEETWASVRSGAPAPEMLAGLILEACDASGAGDLTLATDPGSILDAFVTVRDAFSRAAALRVPAALVPHGSQANDPARATLYWLSCGMWSAQRRLGPRYEMHFGFVPPWQVEKPQAAVSLGADASPKALRELSALGATDELVVVVAEDGRRFLAHPAVDSRSTLADVRLRQGTDSIPGFLVGEVGAPDFVQTAVAFALRLTRGRASSALEAS